MTFDVGEEPGAAAVVQKNRREKRLRPSGGARAGERVVEALEELRSRGFQVVRDIGLEDDDAIEHLVSGPTGVFLIEATYGRYTDEHLQGLRRRAAELFQELDTWVTPVICLAGRSWQKPRRKEKVWIVRRGQVAKWIAGRRNPVLESEQLPIIAAER
jgi:mannose-6-phosphate isomerase-like protein (cupin superfamily)